MSDHLAKPVQLARLIEVVERWLPPDRRIDEGGGRLTDPVAATSSARSPGAGGGDANAVAVFDRDALLERMDGDEESALAVLEALVSDLPAQLARLQRATDAGDLREAFQRAHAIKGAAASVGGLALSVVARAMEERARALDLSEVRDQWPRLEAEAGRLIDAITETFPSIVADGAGMREAGQDAVASV